MAATGPRPRLELSAEEQAQDAEDHGAARRDDRRERLPQGHPHRRKAIAVLAQLLAESCRQEQRVVRRGTHGKDRQDALALAIERDDVAIGEEVDHC